MSENDMSILAPVPKDDDPSVLDLDDAPREEVAVELDDDTEERGDRFEPWVRVTEVLVVKVLLADAAGEPMRTARTCA